MNTFSITPVLRLDIGGDEGKYGPELHSRVVKWADYHNIVPFHMNLGVIYLHPKHEADLRAFLAAIGAVEKVVDDG